MGEFIGLPLKLRSSEIFTLQDRLRSMSGVVYLMDEVSLDGPGSFTKLELLRKIYMETHVPICICGVPRFYYQLYDSRHYDKYCSLITRLDEHEMRGIRWEDAGNYLNMVAEKEALRFTYPAQQALIRIALSQLTAGSMPLPRSSADASPSPESCTTKLRGTLFQTAPTVYVPLCRKGKPIPVPN